MIKMQVISFLFSGFILYTIFQMLKKKRIKEEYSILWFFMGLFFLGLSISPGVIDYLGDLFGVSYAPMFILLLLISFILFILIHFSVVLSKLSEKNKDLIQEVGLLKQELEKLKDD